MIQVMITAIDNGYVISGDGRNMVAHSIEEAFTIARSILTGEPMPVPAAFREEPKPEA